MEGDADIKPDSHVSKEVLYGIIKLYVQVRVLFTCIDVSRLPNLTNLQSHTYMFQYPRGQNASRMCRSCHLWFASWSPGRFPWFFQLPQPLVTPSSVCIILRQRHLENSDTFGFPTRTAAINGTVDTGHGSVNLFLSNLEYTIVWFSMKREKRRAIRKTTDWPPSWRSVCTIKITWHAKKHNKEFGLWRSPAFITSLPPLTMNIFNHRRPKLTIRGIDQIFMIYLRISSETWLLYVCGVVLHIGPLSARSTRHCMEFKITKDKIAQWNKMPLFLNKIK